MKHHTKGPWKVRFTGDKQLTLDHWKDLDPHTIDDKDYEQINTYDAALIAAAPELYEALDELTESFVGFAEKLTDEQRDCLFKAYKALAKAKNET